MDQSVSFSCNHEHFSVCRYKECLLDPSRVSVKLGGLCVSAANVTYRPETLTSTLESVQMMNLSLVIYLTSKLVFSNFGIASLAVDLLWRD